MNRFFKPALLIFVVFFLSCLSGKISFGQEVQSVETQQAEEEKALGIFAGISLEYLPVPENLATNLGAQVGIVFKKRIELSLYGLWMIDKLKRRVIFPEGFQFRYYQGGLSINYLLLPDKKFRPNAGLKLGYGVTGWDPIQGDGESFSDHIIILQPRIGIQYQALKFLIVEANVGYTQTFDVQLIGIEGGDLNGLNFGFGIKMGRF